MKMTRLFVLLLILTPVIAMAQAASEQWLHVRVETPNKGGETVKINVPLSLAETVLPLIREKAISEGKIRIDKSEMTMRDLRKIWEAVKAGGDAEFVTVETADTDLRVGLQGPYLIVRTAERSQSQVEITLPTKVVDALLSGQGEELDVQAAVRALRETGAQEIVSVKDKDAHVRVWIDGSNQGR